MKIVLCGEAWGRREAQFQHPLVGPSGRELTLEMGIANLAPYMTVLCRKCKKETPFTNNHCQHCKEYVWPNEFNLIEHWKTLRREHSIAVTNVFNIQPPPIYYNVEEKAYSTCRVIREISSKKTLIADICSGIELEIITKDIIWNDLGEFFGKVQETEMPPWKASNRISGTHLKGKYFFHIKRLWNELEELKPNLVIALGNAACWATLGQTKITTLRGTINWSEKVKTKVLPTFHPAAILRNPVMRPTTLSDLTKAAREAEFPEIRRPERWITILDPTRDGITEGYEWFKRPARAYAVDIETKRGQITMIGFARSVDDALVIPFRNVDGEILDPNFWPSPELEFDAWKLVEHGLKTLQDKIFQNGIYDMSYLIRMGLHPRNAKHDTMLWHHAMYPELPKSLGYLGSVYANDVAWKSMRRGETLKRDE